MADIDTVTQGSVASSTEGPSQDDERRTKTGRPKNWTPSRERKLTRLYICSSLPPNDIPQALREGDWIPGKDSTTKTVSSLLDTQPRWLRPKTREEMDKRIAGLSECKAKRRMNHKMVSEAVPFPQFAEFTETPLQDLLAFATDQNFHSIFDHGTTSHNSAHHEFSTSDQGITDGDERALELPIWYDSFPLEHVNMPPMVDQRSPSTYISTSSLQRRLPRYSVDYLKGIGRLLKSLSISGTSNTTITEVGYMMSANEENDPPNGSGAFLDSISPNGPFTTPTPPLANAFLNIDRWFFYQGICLPGLKSHDSKSCWCAVMEELRSGSKFWVYERGLVMDVEDPPRSLKHLDSGFQDSFGNTVLHLLAARGAELHVLMEAIKFVDDVNAANTAGQTFLHIYYRDFFRALTDGKTDITMAMERLDSFNIRYHDCDVFGATFFHLLTRMATEQKLLGILSVLNLKLSTGRDAFGWTVAPQIAYSVYRDKIRDPERPIPHSVFDNHYWSPVLLDYSGLASTVISDSVSQLPTDGDALILSHARLLETARLAVGEPCLEDSDGRNGLQCLAEARLDITISEDSVSLSQKAPMELRYGRVQDLLYFGVDPNNYDKQGNTVLMAFVNHLHDGEDDKILAEIFYCLIGYGANLHRRNRQGETALHVAVRLGRKIATRVLLEKGANVHARTKTGEGVLAVGVQHYLKARDDQKLYSSIIACMALAIQYGAVAAPTIVQEWSISGVGDC